MGPQPNHRSRLSCVRDASPIEGGERAYSRVRGQSKEGREHIPGSGANRRRGASIFPGQGPIEGGERA
eukprot:1185848-Prorocentrum_minimum.AAC.3